MDAKAPKPTTTIPDCLLRPQIRLFGYLDEDRFADFQSQLDKVLDQDGQIGFELTTLGGDADAARRIGMDIRIAAEKFGRKIFFIGKSTVYSAGVTVMAAFPRERRFLTRDCVLLIHERRMSQSLNLSGALSSSLQQIKEIEHQLTIGLEIERRGFEMLCEGSEVSCDECRRRAVTNWYVTADEALELRLIEGVL